jgi:hypothetical protein
MAPRLTHGTENVKLSPSRETVASVGSHRPRSRHPGPLRGAVAYGRTLHLSVTADEVEVATAAWVEEIYDKDTDHARHEVQARYWRVAHGDETEQDRQAARLSLALQDRERRMSDPPPRRSNDP